MRSLGLLFLVAGVLVALGGLVQINPIWLYGPYDAGAVSHRRAARLVHGLARRARCACSRRCASHVFGYRVPELLLAGRGLPDADVRLLLFAWPALDHRFGGDPVEPAGTEHHLLVRPRRPTRAAPRSAPRR